jgi:hypothetical protein
VATVGYSIEGVVFEMCKILRSWAREAAEAIQRGIPGYLLSAVLLKH